MRGTTKIAVSILAVFSALSAITGTAAADQLDKIKTKGKIVIGIKNDYKPFGFLGTDGAVQGFEIDLANYIGKQIVGDKGSVELVPVVASNRIELLNQGRIDLIVATLGRTEERAKVLSYSDDYYMLGEGAVVTAKNSSIRKFEDLRGKKLCGILGNSYNRPLTEKYGAQMMLFQGTSEMFKAFEDNRCDGIGFDEPLLSQRVTEPGWAGRYEIRLPAESFIPLAVGVRKNEPQLVNAVNQAITKAEATKLLTSSERKYNMGNSKFLETQQAKAEAASGK